MASTAKLHKGEPGQHIFFEKQVDPLVPTDPLQSSINIKYHHAGTDAGGAIKWPDSWFISWKLPLFGKEIGIFQDKGGCVSPDDGNTLILPVSNSEWRPHEESMAMGWCWTVMAGMMVGMVTLADGAAVLPVPYNFTDSPQITAIFGGDCAQIDPCQDKTEATTTEVKTRATTEAHLQDKTTTDLQQPVGKSGPERTKQEGHQLANLNQPVVIPKNQLIKKTTKKKPQSPGIKEQPAARSQQPAAETAEQPSSNERPATSSQQSAKSRGCHVVCGYLIYASMLFGMFISSQL